MSSLDDLADLDNEELIEILSEHELSDDAEAGDIIMAARAHWFDDGDDKSEVAPEQGAPADADVAAASSWRDHMSERTCIATGNPPVTICLNLWSGLMVWRSRSCRKAGAARVGRR